MKIGRGEDPKELEVAPIPPTPIRSRKVGRPPTLGPGHRLHVDGAGWTRREVQAQTVSHEKANHREDGSPGPGQSLHQETLPVLSIHNHQQMRETAQVSLLIHIYKHQRKKEVQVQTISQRKETHGQERDPGQSLHQEGARDSLPVLDTLNHQKMTEVHSASITNR